MKQNPFLIGCTSLIYFGSLAADWTPPVQISARTITNTVTSVYDPRTQNLVALWEDNLNGTNFSAISSDHGLSWQTAIELSPASNLGTSVFAAYDLTHNQIVATWEVETGSTFPVIGAFSSNGGASWTTGSLASGTDVHVDVFPLYVPNNGSLIATWADENTTHPQAVISTDGGNTWGSAITINTHDVGNDVFTSCNSATGKITAVWIDNTDMRKPVSATSTDGGMTWSSPPAVISTISGFNDVVITYNPVFNTTIATWVSAGGVPESAISTDDGTTWDSTIPISSTPDSNNGSDVYTAVDAVSGITMALWNGGSPNLPYYSLSFDGGRTWSSPLLISSTPMDPAGVFVTFDPVSRTYLATWSQNRTPWSALFTLNILANQGGNVERLATYLNTLSATSPQLLTPLLMLSASQLEDALTTMLPKPSIRLSAANTTLVMSNIMVNRSSERTVMRRLQNAQPSISALYLETNTLVAENNDQMTLPHGSTQTAAHKKNKYAIWAEGFGEFAHQKGEDQLPSFDTTTGGAMVGFDYYVANGQLSTAFAYADSSVKSSMEHDKVNFYALALYGIGYIGDGFLEAGVWGVYNRFHQNRHIFFPGFNEHAKADYNGWQCAPHLRGGYDFTTSHWILEPFVQADCAIIHQNGFSEHGASPYNMKQKDSTSELLQGSSGLNAYTWREQLWGSWFFRATLAYMYKKGFEIGKLSNEAIVGQSPGFSVIAYKTAQNLFVPGAEFFLRGNNGIFGAVNYEGQVGSKYASNSIFGKIGVFF